MLNTEPSGGHYNLNLEKLANDKSDVLFPAIVWNLCESCDFIKFFFFFFLNNFGGHIHMSYFGATDTPVLDFWWRLLWVSKAERAALFALQRRT